MIWIRPSLSSSKKGTVMEYILGVYLVTIQSQWTNSMPDIISQGER